MKIEVEPEKCIAAGVCVAMAPDHFDQDDDTGEVVLLDATPDVGTEPSVRLAVEACPVRAILVSG